MGRKLLLVGKGVLESREGIEYACSNLLHSFSLKVYMLNMDICVQGIFIKATQELPR
jgi:hypothetical protein